MTQGPQEPDETLPLTHRPYGKQPDDNPYASPSGPGAPPPPPPSGPPPAAPPSLEKQPPQGQQPPQSPYGQQPPYPTTPYGQAPYGQAPYGQAPHGQAPYGQAPYGQPGYATAHKGATTSMVLGIVSVASFVLALGCCVTLPGVLTAPFAFFIARSARKEIDANPGAYNNRGNAVTGFVLGIIGMVLALLTIAAVVVFIIAVGHTPDTTPYDGGT